MAGRSVRPAPPAGWVRARPMALSWPRWVTRNLAVVLVARASMSAVRAMAGVVTAPYLASQGLRAVQLGLLFLGVTAVSAAMSSAIGIWSDRVGRRPFLVVVPVLVAASAAAYAVTRTPWVLVGAAALGGFGRGSGAGAGAIGPYQPAETALVADEVPADRRADAFGWLSFASGVGALAGGLLAGLAQPPPGAVGAAANLAYRPAFVAMGVLALASGLLALALRESRPTPARPAGPKVARTWPRRSWDALWRFWLTNAANGAAMGLFGPFVSYWLYRRYGASPQAIGLLFAVVNLTSLGSVLSAAPLARRWGTVRTIVWARLVSGVLLVPMVQAPSFTLAGAVYVVRMLAQRVGLPLRQSYVQAWTHPQERASMAALTNLPAQVTQGLGQVAAGYLMDEVGLSVPFELAAGFQCLNAFLYALLFRGREEGRAGASSG